MDRTSRTVGSTNQTSKIYIGNLKEAVANATLADEFSRFGPIREVWVSRKHCGYAFVDFYNHRDARTAVKEMDGENVFGVTLKVELSRKKTQSSSDREDSCRKSLIENPAGVPYKNNSYSAMSNSRKVLLSTPDECMKTSASFEDLPGTSRNYREKRHSNDVYPERRTPSHRPYRTTEELGNHELEHRRSSNVTRKTRSSNRDDDEEGSCTSRSSSRYKLSPHHNSDSRHGRGSSSSVTRREIRDKISHSRNHWNTRGRCSRSRSPSTRDQECHRSAPPCRRSYKRVTDTRDSPVTTSRSEIFQHHEHPQQEQSQINIGENAVPVIVYIPMKFFNPSIQRHQLSLLNENTGADVDCANDLQYKPTAINADVGSFPLLQSLPTLDSANGFVFHNFQGSKRTCNIKGNPCRHENSHPDSRLPQGNRHTSTPTQSMSISEKNASNSMSTVKSLTLQQCIQTPVNIPNTATAIKRHESLLVETPGTLLSKESFSRSRIYSQPEIATRSEHKQAQSLMTSRTNYTPDGPALSQMGRQGTPTPSSQSNTSRYNQSCEKLNQSCHNYSGALKHRGKDAPPAAERPSVFFPSQQ